jgi:hypothetical protein
VHITPPIQTSNSHLYQARKEAMAKWKDATNKHADASKLVNPQPERQEEEKEGGGGDLIKATTEVRLLG